MHRYRLPNSERKDHAKPLLNIITTTICQIGNLLFAVRTTIDTFRNLAYLLCCEPLSVKKIEQTRAFLALVTYQSKKDWIEITTTATGNTKRKLKAMTIPATTTKAIALFSFIIIDE